MLEFWAVALTVLCIFLAGRDNILTWPVGIIAAGLYGLVFHDAKLYADVLLQAFFIGTGVYGWAAWSKRTEEEKNLVVRHMRLTILIPALAASVFLTFAYSTLLKELTDAAAPFWDSAVLCFSILGQILLMRRYVEAWPVWIMVNVLAVPLFYSRELYMSAVLYGAFLLHAGYAWDVWMAKAKAKS